MSEREGLYCGKHERYSPTGVCDYCAPVPLVAELAPLEPNFAQAVASLVRPCDHAAGYCKDTAHKYELPTTEIKSGVLLEMEMAIESGILEWPVADPEE